MTDISPPTDDRNGPLVRRLLIDCFQPMAPRAIDRYSDSPRVRGIYASVIAAFPDAGFVPDWIVSDGHRVALSGLVRATHQGEWRGVPATGRAVEVLTTLMLDLSDGGIVDLRVVTDSLTLAEQLGAVASFGPKACELLDAGRGLGAGLDGPTRAGAADVRRGS